MDTPASPDHRCAAPAIPDRVRVVGTGLIGTSIGLGLRRCGVDVSLSDLDEVALETAVRLGAGRPERAVPRQDGQPSQRPVEIVVVAVPPDDVPSVVERELRTYSAAVVTDVASVKEPPVSALSALPGPLLSRYVPGHPMAGAERSSVQLASGAMFHGRPWVLTPSADTQPGAEQVVLGLVRALGAQAVRMSAADHDSAVALISHLPQLVSSVTASMLVDHESQLSMAGPGLGSVVRLSAASPHLWEQVLRLNAERLLPHLQHLITELEATRGILEASRAAHAGRPVAALSMVIERGNDGRRALTTATGVGA